MGWKDNWTNAAGTLATSYTNPLGVVGGAISAGYQAMGKEDKKNLDQLSGGWIGDMADNFGIEGIKNAAGSAAPKVYKPGGYEINSAPFNEKTDLSNHAGNWMGVSSGLHDDKEAASGRLPPGMDTSQQAHFRAGQTNLAQQLAEQAAGRGPSLASLQMKQNTDDAIRSAMAMAASGRSGTAGGRLKQAQDQASMLQQQGARDSAALRIQEQMAARQQLGGLLGQGRQQDIGIATQDLGAALQQTGMNDSYGLGLGQLGLGYDKLGLDATTYGTESLQELEKLKLQKYIAEEQAKAASIASANQAQGGMLSAAGGLISGIVSDKNAKKNIKDGDGAAKDFLSKIADQMGIKKEPDYSEMPEGDRMKEFLSRLQSYEYDYKDPEHGEGKKVSPMAQDLEADPISRAMVMDSPDGIKRVDYDQPGLMLAGLATLSRENDELRGIVEKLAKKRSA